MIDFKKYRSLIVLGSVIIIFLVLLLSLGGAVSLSDGGIGISQPDGYKYDCTVKTRLYPLLAGDIESANCQNTFSTCYVNGGIGTFSIWPWSDKEAELEYTASGKSYYESFTQSVLNSKTHDETLCFKQSISSITVNLRGADGQIDDTKAVNI